MEYVQQYISAQVHFLDAELALIHIPLQLYNFFLHSILNLLIPSDTGETESGDEPANPFDHGFLNISVTPVECSVACSRKLADEIFVRARNELDEVSRGDVAISRDDYIIMQVDGDGLAAGQRVVELTSPMAMNGISIFFISTYFSDYILVPKRCRTAVIEALEARGFTFDIHSESFVSKPATQPPSNRNSGIFGRSVAIPIPTSPHENPFARTFSSSSLNSAERPPPTPPPSSLDELRSRTFTTLKRRNISPHVNPDLHLVQCAERKPNVRGKGDEAPYILANTAMRMQFSLMKCLISVPRPSFFSMTIVEGEAASFLLEQRLLPHFVDRLGAFSKTAATPLLLGDLEDVLVPIVLDLRELPTESTGIVCGVVGQLVAGSRSEYPTSPGSPVDNRLLEMGYLSTARAGTVIVPQSSLESAMRALATALIPR